MNSMTLCSPSPGTVASLKMTSRPSQELPCMRIGHREGAWMDTQSIGCTSCSWGHRQLVLQPQQPLSSPQEVLDAVCICRDLGLLLPLHMFPDCRG